MVGLGHHGGRGLDENVVAGEAGRFESNVSIHDSTVGGLQIHLVGAKSLHFQVQALLLGSVLSQGGGKVLDEPAEIRHREVVFEAEI